MVIYADVLVAINYFVGYALLCGTARIAGIPLGRRGRVRGALVGGLSALAVFLPLQGIVFGVLLRAATALLMLWAAWPGRILHDYIRLGVVLFGTSFLFAGAVMMVCLLWPQMPVSCPAGVVYFDISPFTLLVSVVVCYLLVGLIKRFYAQNKGKALVYGAKVIRKEKEVSLRLMRDSGNRLTEPFSGLPVAVCTRFSAEPLLTEEERVWLDCGMPPEKMPVGIRLVPYHSVGASGLLAAFRPDKFVLEESGRQWDCEAWLAVNPYPMPGCDGVFDPAMLELRI